MKRFFFKHTTLALVLTALCGALIALGGATLLLWRFRQHLISYVGSRVASSFVTQQNGTFALSPGGAQPSTTLEKQDQDLSVTGVVDKANKSVVAIEVYQQVPTYETIPGSFDINDFFSQFFSMPQQQRRQIGTEERKVGGGSGFFVSSNGLLVTNRHVVDAQNATFKVVTSTGKTYTATLLASDPVIDIAVLKVAGGTFTPLSLGDSSGLQLGQSVVAIGFALGEFNNSVSTGIVSGLGRSVVAGNGMGQSENLDQLIQTDAAINPGNSGGPLLNLRGEVIGINVAVAQGSQNVGFALPINMVKSIIESVRATGTITRPYLGIRYVQVTPTVQQQNNLSVDYGVWVKAGGNVADPAVIPGSPAQKAGIIENDIILSIDGVKLTSDTSLAAIIRQKRVGQRISCVLLRNGIQRTITVTLESTK